MVVSYGGHGGVKAAAQLRQVLRAVGMEVVEAMPALAFPSERVLGLAAKGEALPLGGEEGIWREEREGVWRAFGELMVLVARK